VRLEVAKQLAGIRRFQVGRFVNTRIVLVHVMAYDDLSSAECVSTTCGTCLWVGQASLQAAQ
jgi:hypothetical protein